jgi:hypothetical protein
MCLGFAYSNRVITRGLPCELNVNLIKKLSSLASNNIMTNWNCFVPMVATNIVEDVDNARKSNNIKEDKGSGDEHEIHRMSLAWVINHRCCPYMHMRILT